MTFKEKYKKDFPEAGDYCGCPCTYGYEEGFWCELDDNCDECWDREMPESLNEVD